MVSALLFVPIFLPIIFGILLKFINIKNENIWKGLSLGAVVATSIITWILLFVTNEKEFTLVAINESISFSLKLDGAGKIFSGMVSLLWPVALYYSFVYMKHDEKRYAYNCFYIETFGVVLGISFSSNLLTMYFFYEALTFITLPLIIHYQTKEAKKAGRAYLYFSLSGSSLALAGLVILTIKAGTNNFVAGGLSYSSSLLMSLAYLFTFFGFGVKSALFPLCYWLPMAGAAPTPTTALLHAVAVVKAGAFALIRTTYYNFSYMEIRASWVQYVCLGFIAFTIIYGSTKALKEQHLKRRFAYSTIANLSYILFGVLLCTKEGLNSSFLHFIAHSLAKISIFFCCGAIIETSSAKYVYELNGLGKKMPLIFIIYTLSGLSLIGMPLFGGFVSKYYLIASAFKEGSVMAYLGIGALIYSAILTACYVLTITIRAFVKKPLEKYDFIYQNAKEAETGFLLTSGIFALLSILLGIFASPLVEIIQKLVGVIL